MNFFFYTLVSIFNSTKVLLEKVELYNLFIWQRFLSHAPAASIQQQNAFRFRLASVVVRFHIICQVLQYVRRVLMCIADGWQERHRAERQCWGCRWTQHDELFNIVLLGNLKKTINLKLSAKKFFIYCKSKECLQRVQICMQLLQALAQMQSAQMVKERRIHEVGGRCQRVKYRNQMFNCGSQSGYSIQWGSRKKSKVAKQYIHILPEQIATKRIKNYYL